jgi:hypothetical protein
MTIDARSTGTVSPEKSATARALMLTNGFAKGKRDVWIFLFALILYGLVLLPILLSNRYHLEDISRLIGGDYGWVGEGRPLTAFLMMALNLFGHGGLSSDPAIGRN